MFVGGRAGARQREPRRLETEDQRKPVEAGHRFARAWGAMAKASGSADVDPSAFMGEVCAFLNLHFSHFYFRFTGTSIGSGF